MDPEDARGQLLSDFGEPFLRDLTRTIGRSYPESFNSVGGRFSDRVGRDLYPHERRALIEEKLPTLRVAHPHVRISPSTNRSDNCHFHRITANRSVLTVSKTDGPQTLPRDADFRRTLAVNPQLALFQLVPDESAMPAIVRDAVYGVVIHGPDPKHSQSVAFVQILIPDATGKLILDAIDLFHFWDADERPREFPSVPIDPVGPRLKPGRRHAEEETQS